MQFNVFESTRGRRGARISAAIRCEKFPRKTFHFHFATITEVGLRGLKGVLGAGVMNASLFAQQTGWHDEWANWNETFCSEVANDRKGGELLLVCNFVSD